jgi:hypothetical protein
MGTSKLCQPFRTIQTSSKPHKFDVAREGPQNGGPYIYEIVYTCCHISMRFRGEEGAFPSEAGARNALANRGPGISVRPGTHQAWSAGPFFILPLSFFWFYCPCRDILRYIIITQ